MDASDSEALESSVRTVLTFLKGNCSFDPENKLTFQSRSMNKASATKTSLQLILKNTSGESGLGEDKAEDIGGWNQACLYSKLLSA